MVSSPPSPEIVSAPEVPYSVSARLVPLIVAIGRSCSWPSFRLRHRDVCRVPHVCGSSRLPAASPFGFRLDGRDALAPGCAHRIDVAVPWGTALLHALCLARTRATDEIEVCAL